MPAKPPKRIEADSTKVMKKPQNHPSLFNITPDENSKTDRICKTKIQNH
jgi:hypothetical protein